MSEELVQKVYKVTDGAIHGFFRDHRFLSNYHVCQIQWEGYAYQSTEAAYHASKSLDPEVRALFTRLSPHESKVQGRKVDMRPDWDQVKNEIMFKINMVKFTTHQDLATKLLETGEKELVEDNWWNDRYWGRHFGDGENHLGRILMLIRSMVRSNERLENALIV